MEKESKPFASGADASDKYKPQTYANNAEYFAALEKWLHDAYMWQSITAAFPYALMSNQFAPANAINMQHFNASQSGANVFPYMTFVHNGDILRNRRTQVATVRPNQHRQTEGIEYRVPPLWKRFIAEFLDFLILFFLKLAVTFVAVDFFDFIDLDKYDLDVLQRNVKIDYKIALEMTSEILLLELIHRIVVCIFETFWLQRGIGGRIGGATPGKTMMGIRVVLCTKVTPVEGRPMDVIVVHPGTDLGLGWAFARSFVKNLVLAVLFPICFALFFFRHNRTGYDIMCRTIVVEDPPRQRH
ncbi:protein FAM8A1 [Periplaneta americana]|uniref:protein FAM8A1 n=1 Tax=Periplaneta americana TaxID=6978 RepID=UPI0037E84B54